METTKKKDYSKISVIDMCYFLNGKTDFYSNKYLKRLNTYDISKVDMHDYLKVKTDNFDKYKFDLVFGEISDFCFNMDFYRRAFVDGKVINKWVTEYEVDYNFTDKQPYEYICRTLELNKGLIVNCQQIVEFVKMAEDLYKKVCENTETNTNNNNNNNNPPMKLIKSLTKNQQKYLYNQLTEGSLFLSVGTDFDSFCFVFGNSMKPDNFKPLRWLKNRQLLRELITELKHPDITIPTSKFNLPPYFIDKDNNPIIELPTNTPKDLKIEHYLENLAKM